MQRRVIPQDEWREELDRFSRSHQDWIVRVSVTEPSGRVHVEATDLPLLGVSIDGGRVSTIDVMVGDGPGAHLTHQINDATEIAFEQTTTGAVAALVISDGAGTETSVAFRSPMLPEEVDGLPARHSVSRLDRKSVV